MIDDEELDGDLQIWMDGGGGRWRGEESLRKGEACGGGYG
jgi:hypothetical protein